MTKPLMCTLRLAANKAFLRVEVPRAEDGSLPDIIRYNERYFVRLDPGESDVYDEMNQPVHAVLAK